MSSTTSLMWCSFSFVQFSMSTSSSSSSSSSKQKKRTSEREKCINGNKMWIDCAVQFTLDWITLFFSLPLSCSFWLEALFIFVSNTLHKRRNCLVLLLAFHVQYPDSNRFFLSSSVLLTLIVWFRRDASRLEHGVSEVRWTLDRIPFSSSF